MDAHRAGSEAEHKGGLDNLSGAVTSVSGLTLTGGNGGVTLEGTPVAPQGSASRGGGIRNEANLTLEEAVLSGSDADSGGGIYNGASLTVRRTTIEGNRA